MSINDKITPENNSSDKAAVILFHKIRFFQEKMVKKAIKTRKNDENSKQFLENE